MTRVRDVGEFGLIDRLAGRLHRRLPPRASVAVAIGDDAAVWQPSAGTVSVLSTDTMIDGVHFTRETIPWRLLGWKSVAVNVSDLAAMAAEPRLAVATLGLTGDEDLGALDELYDGIADAAAEWRLSVVGGDTVRAPRLQVGFSVVGEAPTGPSGPEVLRRDAARAGDVLAVTGHPGDSAGGLALLLTNRDRARSPSLIRAHQMPRARVTEARWLFEHGVRCATDNSDGLLREVEFLCAASSVGAVVTTSDLPLSEELRLEFADRAVDLALGGGEDYELVLAVPTSQWPAVLAAWQGVFSTSLAAVGCFTAKPVDGPAVRVVGQAPVRSGFDHFASPSV